MMERGVLVIGGGIAGISAALKIAEHGIQVHLVERAANLGGLASWMYTTFPRLNCARCALYQLMMELSSHSNVNIFTLSEVKDVSYKSGSYRVKLLKYPRFVDESKCTGCGKCTQACPYYCCYEENGLAPLVHKCIHILYPQAIPNLYHVDIDNCMKCSNCVSVCERSAINFLDKPMEFKLDVNSVLIATGCKIVPSLEGYTKYPNVIQSLELEILLSTGLFDEYLEKVLSKSMPKTIVFIQPENLELYYAIITKQALMIKEKLPDSKIVICCRNIDIIESKLSEFDPRKTISHEIEGINHKLLGFSQQDGRIKIHCRKINGSKLSLDADLVVISSKMVQSETNLKLFNMFGIEPNSEKFLVSSRDNVFTVGCASGPKSILDSMNQAVNIASKIIELHSRT